ncbi:type VII secretion target [Kitasatospora sp. NPDC002551]|uniref:WXG100 family type VII secretion target n=1 Tax=Kitasatospora sp. NPDC002551 TaxID=3154539 RepID=UPI003326FA62
MADVTTEAQQNPWLYGQDGPPSGIPHPGGPSGAWASGPPAGAPVRVEPAALRQAAGASRRLQGELRSTVSHAEPDTAAAAQALSADCFSSGAALTQVLTWWKARWTSLDNRLGMTADRLEATAAAYRSTDTSSASAFKAP